MTNPVGASLPGAAPNEPYASQKRHRDEAEREVQRRGFAEGKLQLLWRTPECFTRTYDMGEVIAAICEALTREGCTAWSGDGTSCVEQMIRLQWDRAVKAEAEVARLRAALEAGPLEQNPQFQELLAAEHALSDAYLRLRRKLAPFGAFDTPRAPSGPQVWATTELALDKALRVSLPPPKESK